MENTEQFSSSCLSDLSKMLARQNDIHSIVNITVEPLVEQLKTGMIVAILTLNIDHITTE